LTVTGFGPLILLVGRALRGIWSIGVIILQGKYGCTWRKISLKWLGRPKGVGGLK
jgi:hypothetical protein